MINTAAFEVCCEHGFVWGLGCPTCDVLDIEEDSGLQAEREDPMILLFGLEKLKKLSYENK
jgi:hypothetical protein